MNTLEANRAVFSQCINNKPCSSCIFCPLPNPWEELNYADYLGPCPDGSENTQYYNYTQYVSDYYISFYFCLENDIKPLYYKSIYPGGVFIYYNVLKWDPNPPPADKFIVPETCRCRFNYMSPVPENESRIQKDISSIMKEHKMIFGGRDEIENFLNL